MSIDYSALLYDPVYAELGVEAVLTTAGTAGEVALTVIDDTRPKTITSGSAEVRSVGPGAFVRIPELAENGVEREDYLGAMLEFNGRAWEVRSYELRGSPNGEDVGEVRFLLKAAEAIISGLAIGAAAGIGSAAAVSEPSLPAGVTLQDIDGGPTYYADNNFINAVNAGWDDPAFFPISMFLEKMRDQADADVWHDLNCNTCCAVQGDGLFSVMRDNNINYIVQSEEWNDTGSSIYVGNSGTLGSESVGFHVDEPSTYAAATDPLADTLNSFQDNKFWHETFTHNQVHSDIGGVEVHDLLDDLISTPNATTRHINIADADVYFFAGATNAAWTLIGGQFLYNLGRDMTEDEMSRGCRYGDLIDMQRGNGPYDNLNWYTIHDAPRCGIIETGTPYSENTTESTAIRSQEINAAVWSSIINGARWINYFTLGDAGSWGGAGLVQTTFWQTPYNGDSVSNYHQVKATNALIISLATVINSPFAIGYVTVSPPAVRITASVDDSGFDVMAKYHNVASGDNKFYIFAMPRTNATSQNATFTIANTGATQVTVINEARTISVTGGTTFTDNFATGNTVHIYRVD